MQLSPSAHVDTFCRDSLPPDGLWPELRFSLPGLRYPERLNGAVELLDATADARGGDRPCLLSEGATWSYDDLVRASNQVAWVLVDELGLVPGNRVLLRGPNNPWLAACWLGVLKAGGVAVTAMSLLRAAELSTVCEIAQARLALCDHRFTGELAAAGVDGLQIVSYGAAGPQDDLVQRAAPMPRNFAAVDTAADDVAMIAFTSGTTGRPKAAMHFHRDLLAIADTFSAHVLKPRAEDIFTGTPPLAFTYGLGGLLVFPLRAGAATLLLERHLPASTWQAFYDATGVKIIDGIGSTEMLHIFISSADDEIRPGSTGRVVPGYEAAILNDDGKPAGDGEPGRLAVKGPTGCRYLADDRQQAYVQNGWNLTGDTYIRDADGYFWYQARSDDIIISAGYNIAGPEIEEVLLGHPDVAECGVVGVPDEARGQIVKAYVVLREDATGDEAKASELQDYVKRQIAPYKYPRAVQFLAGLPRTSTGKLQRFRLRERT